MSKAAIKVVQSIRAYIVHEGRSLPGVAMEEDHCLYVAPLMQGARSTERGDRCRGPITCVKEQNKTSRAC